MGGGVSVIPDDLDEATCRQVLGPSFDEALFHNLSHDGFLSKAVLAQKLSSRTDVFLTHDWGGADQANHKNVSKINKVLKEMGLRTWFDEEQMTGNIKKQMVQGIDNSNCVVVFITKRYVQKVCSENAGDNCQLEFNYASLQKTANKMVAVVMEEPMRNTKIWGGEVGMVLGGNLYVDMCGDLDDETYIRSQCKELYDAVLQRTGKTMAQFLESMGSQLEVPPVNITPTTPHSSKPRPDKAAGGEETNNGSSSQQKRGFVGPTVPLEDLTVEDVGALLSALKMGAYREAAMSNDIDGACLAAVESPEELKEMGVTMTAKAKMLFGRLAEFAANGVPEEYTHAAVVRREEEQKRAEEEERAAAEKKAAEERAAAAQLAAEERAVQEKKAAEEKAAKEKAEAERKKKEAEEKAKKDEEAAEARAKQEAKEREEALKRAIEQKKMESTGLPELVTVAVHKHQLKLNPSNSGGWACDGKNFCGGCKSGCTGFNQLKGKTRYKCANGCDYDLCEKCVREHRYADQLPSSFSVKCHAHNLTKTAGDNGWACDGRHLSGGCKSGCTGFKQLHGWNRYRCASCDYDLCEKCARAQRGSQPTSSSSSSSSSTVHKTNDEGAAVHLGSTGSTTSGKRLNSNNSLPANKVYYCGRRMNQCRCGGCDGRCGPTNGCPCKSCLRLLNLPKRTVQEDDDDCVIC